MAGNSHHGHTLAGWTGVTIMFIGFLVGGVYMVLGELLGVLIGLAVVIAGGVVGLVMRGMGFGQEPAKPVRMASGE